MGDTKTRERGTTYLKCRDGRDSHDDDCVEGNESSSSQTLRGDGNSTRGTLYYRTDFPFPERRPQ